MHQQRVAWPHARPPGSGPVGAGAPEVVGAHQALVGRLDLRAAVAGRIYMEYAAAGIGHGLGPCAHGQGAHGRAADAIRIAQREARLIRSVRLQVQDAAREHRRHQHVHLRLAVDAFAAQPEQWLRRFPVAAARLAIGDFDFRVAIGVAVDEPLEAQVLQRGWINQQLAGQHPVRIGRRTRGRRGCAAAKCGTRPTIAQHEGRRDES